MKRIVLLETPPIRCIVPDGVFDAFGWCASDRLAWGSPAAAPLDQTTPITAANPPGMVFVIHGDDERVAFLPRELAALHLGGLGLANEWALAPWAIDDATDLLHANGVRPGEHLWLATASRAGLFWGLHDWAHFHNHGAFEAHQRAWTELQCDAAALAWTWGNRAAIGLTDEDWEAARREVVAVGAARFEADGATFDVTRLAPDVIRGLLSG